MIEQIINMSDLHIMSKGIYDASHEEINTLVELTMASNLLVTMANSLHIGVAGFDSQMILHGDSTTLNVMKATRNAVIDNTFPFIKWIGKIIKFTIVILLILAVIIIIIKFRMRVIANTRKQESLRTKKDIVNFLATLQGEENKLQTKIKHNNAALAEKFEQ